MNLKEIRRFRENWQAESEAVYLYRRLKDNEDNPKLKEVYEKLAVNEEKHVAIWAGKLASLGVPLKLFRPRFKPQFLALLAGTLGAGSVIPLIASIERNAAQEYAGQTENEIPALVRDESSHARVFSYLARNGSGLEGSAVARFEGRHHTGGNALRAGVLGANDGLVSVFCIVMGVAGAAQSSSVILITGVAGLLACALSMALGEWLSVQNARELYQNQLKIEEQELEEAPEEEKEELILIYQAKGVERGQAERMVEQIFQDKATAIDTLVREELAIDPEELGGSAWEAALTSFVLCLVGGILPVFPYFLWTGPTAVLASALSSVVGLFVLGFISSLITGLNWVWGAARQILFGVAAAAVTYGIGMLIGRMP
ncbi:MAG: VIT1/CCC1 transporter family protein [Spirochaetales bacterium]